MTILCKNLQSIYDLEVRLGNKVARIDEPAGSECPYAILFSKPLHLKEINKHLTLPETVKFWESKDPHYEVANGYRCVETRHVISGLLK